jgi:hypothetical protein
MIDDIKAKKGVRFLDDIININNYHNRILDNHFSDLKIINNEINIKMSGCLLTPNQLYEQSVTDNIINFDKLKKVIDDK